MTIHVYLSIEFVMLILKSNKLKYPMLTLSFHYQKSTNREKKIKTKRNGGHQNKMNSYKGREHIR